MGEGNKYLWRQSLSPYRGKSTSRALSEGVRLYPLGQYMIVVNQDYIGLVQTVFFSCFRGGFVEE